MKKSTFFLSALMASAVGLSMMTSCKDYEEDDFAELQLQQQQDGKDIDALMEEIKKLQDLICKCENGHDGADGKSAYDLWKASNYAKDMDNDGDIDEDDFFKWMEGKTGATGATGGTGAAGDKGDKGESAYDLWKNSSEAVDKDGDGDIDKDDFLLWMKGETGATGATGATGDKGDKGESAYDLWKASSEASDLNGDGNIDEADFYLYIKGQKGEDGNDGHDGHDGQDGQDGQDGKDGKSAYDLWLDYMEAEGLDADVDGDGKETLADMILWLKGEKGDQGAAGIDGTDGTDGQDGQDGANGADGKDGLSAYEVWRQFTFDNGIVNDLNGDGTVDELDFFLYLKGDKGDQGEKGEDGEDAAGTNCEDEEACKNAQAVVYRLTNALIGKNGNLTDTELDQFEALVKKAYEDLYKAIKAIEYLQDAMAKQVTGVLIQQTSNPVFGAFNTPFGINSNVLMAYYGEADYFNFPLDPQFMNDDQYNNLTAAGLAVPSYEHTAADGITVDGKGNAGTLYLTINPNTVDFTGLKVALVNSIDEESAATLEPLAKETETVLSFGISRAADNNGFYSAAATIDENAINSGKATMRFDKEGLKDAIKDVISFRDGINWTNLGNVIYKNSSNILDAQAVKVSWTDTVFNVEAGTKTIQEHSVYSQYNLAAAAVKPLSYKTFAGINIQHLPGYERAGKALDAVLDKIMGIDGAIDNVFGNLTGSITIDLGIDTDGLATAINNVVIPTVQLEELSPELLAKFKKTITVDVQIDTTLFRDGGTYHDGIHVDFDDLNQQIQDLIASIKYQYQTPETDADGNIMYPINMITKEASINTDDIDDITLANIDVANINLHMTYHYSETIDMTDAVQELYDNMAASIEDVNTGLGSFEDFLEELKSFIADFDDVNANVNSSIDDVINNIKDGIKNTITSYQNGAANIINGLQNLLDRVDSKAVGLINRANAIMQPTMVVDMADGSKLLSSSKYAPTTVSSNVTLYPTSYNVEFLAPAFKKYVAVTNVFDANDLTKSVASGDAFCKLALQTANEHEALNVILPGATRAIANVALEAGYVYEISYLAVDFGGEAANKVFYVKVQ